MMDRYSAQGDQRMQPDMSSVQRGAGLVGDRRQPFGWWAALTMPRYSEDAQRDPRIRERYRRAQLASAAIPVLFLLLLSQLKTALVNTPTAVGLGVLAAACVIGLLLNRAGFITTAGVLLVVALLFSILAAIVTMPGGLSLVWLPVFQVVTLAIILAGLLLPRWMTFVTAFITSAVASAIILLEPHAPNLAAYIQQYSYAPILLRIYAEYWIAAILVVLLSRSIEQAVVRADRAEDLASAEAQIARQTQYIAEQNARLEYGIQQLLETHRRVASGDFTVRTPTQQDNELWQIGVSLNNLISRFSRLAISERRLMLTEDALRNLAMQIDVARRGGQPMWPQPSGTAADQILQALGVVQSASGIYTAPFTETTPGISAFGPAPDPHQSMPGSSNAGQLRNSGSWSDPIE